VYDFRRLDVWRKAHELTAVTYRSLPIGVERRFPALASQMRRASASVPANIAEGCGHSSRREFARFLQHATASAHELHYHLILGRELGVLPSSTFAKLEARTEEVKKMLSGLIKHVRSTMGEKARDLPPSPVTRRL
jgi:four helix bundle protein